MLCDGIPVCTNTISKASKPSLATALKIDSMFLDNIHWTTITDIVFLNPSARFKTGGSRSMRAFQWRWNNYWSNSLCTCFCWVCILQHWAQEWLCQDHIFKPGKNRELFPKMCHQSDIMKKLWLAVNFDGITTDVATIIRLAMMMTGAPTLMCNVKVIWNWRQWSFFNPHFPQQQEQCGHNPFIT